MIILLGVLLLVWAGVFGFLWDWAMRNVDGWWGGLLPVGWFVLAPCVVFQIALWSN